MTLPNAIEQSITRAATHLSSVLRCSVQDAPTHRVVVVEGWADDQATIDAIAAYLVGLLASAISLALTVRASIEDTTEDRLELRANVEKLVGSATVLLSSDQKQDERNPWMAEGIWHLCLFLAQQRTDLHPLGKIIALDHPHVAAKDHGFDVVAVYQGLISFGMAFIECKAYENNPNGAINSAVDFFRELEAGTYDARARQVMSALRVALAPALQQQVSPSLWKQERELIPNPHYDVSAAVDWKNPRPSFNGLSTPVERRVIMPNELPGFTSFFDRIGDAMIQLVQGF